MAANITEIKIPQENVNDETVVISEFLVDDMSEVTAGTEIACLETSKATFTITAPESGFLHFLAEPGSEVPVGDILAVIGKDKAALEAYQKPPQPANDDALQAVKPIEPVKKTEKTSVTTAANTWNDYADVRTTMAAQRVLSEKGLTAEELGLKGLVRLSDVLQRLGVEKIHQNQSDNIIILGGGGLCKMLIETIRKSNSFNIIGIIDSNIEKGQKVLGVEVIGNDAIFEDLFKKAIQILSLLLVQYHQIIKAGSFH
jgi:hypothetical protein